MVRAKALTDAYTAKHPNVTFDLTTRPDGQDGETILKTQLASGDIGDLFWYNSGSLLQALNPAQSMLPVTGSPWLSQIQESYLPTVTVGGDVYGAPNEPAMGGGILYNKKIFADLGLQVPKTWAEFVANNEKIKAAKITPVGHRSPVTAAGPRRSSCWPTTATSSRRSQASPRSTPTTRPTTPIPRQRLLASSTSRTVSTRSGSRRTSARPPSTTPSTGSPRASGRSIRC